MALPEVDALMERLDAEKADQRETLRRRAEDALAALRAVDEEGWEKVRG